MFENMRHNIMNVDKYECKQRKPDDVTNDVDFISDLCNSLTAVVK